MFVSKAVAVASPRSRLATAALACKPSTFASAVGLPVRPAMAAAVPAPAAVWSPSVGVCALLTNPASLLTSRLTATPPLGSRASSSYSSVAVLRRAETNANTCPEDSTAQAEYMAALNSARMHDEVISRFESGLFEIRAEAPLQEYARALVQSGAVPETEHRGLLASLRAQFIPFAGAGAGAGAGRSAAGARGMHTSVHSDRGFAPGSGGQQGFRLPGGYGQGGGHGGAPGYGAGMDPSMGAPGSPNNPMVVTVTKASKPMDMFMTLVRAGLTIWLLYMLYEVLKNSRGGMPGGLEALTGGRAKENSEVPETRFKDVKGIDEARDELEDIVDFLRNPQKYTRLGAKVPRGVLLTGPPGTGKTLLARAVAGEANVPFYSRSASEFEEMLVGLGAKRVRELFTAAQAHAPAIIFIDEIDAMGSKRGRVSVGTGSERQTLNQLLACMDGFSKNDGVIVIAATNSPEILDSALTRPGRFDTKVAVQLPDKKGRKEILDLYLSKVIVSDDVNAALLASATPGFSGADLEALVNSAALMAANKNLNRIYMEEFEEARDKIIMGPARRSKVQRQSVLRMTAFHEAGHTLTAMLTDHAEMLHKVTILPRGQSGGATYFLPEHRDEGYETRAQVLAQIDVAMGGRVAEELLLGLDHVTTGAGSDMAKASELARRFCMVYSMSRLGLTSYAQTKPSAAMQADIDREVEAILTESYARVKALLISNRNKLDLLAKALLEHETLSANQCQAAVDGKPVPGVSSSSGGSGGGKSLWGRLFGGGSSDSASDAAAAPAAPAAASSSSSSSSSGSGSNSGSDSSDSGSSGSGSGSGGSSKAQKGRASTPAPHTVPAVPDLGKGKASDGGSVGDGDAKATTGRRWV